MSIANNKLMINRWILSIALNEGIFIMWILIFLLSK